MSFQLSDPCVCAKISGIVTGQTLQVLPVHIILGNSECRRITIPKPKRAGREWGPVATYTKMVFTQTSSVNYKEHRKLDVLGLADLPTGDQAVVYEDFKEELQRRDEGWNETLLPWEKGATIPWKLTKKGTFED